jgi:hypothetical protein
VHRLSALQMIAGAQAAARHSFTHHRSSAPFDHGMFSTAIFGVFEVRERQDGLRRLLLA